MDKIPFRSVMLDMDVLLNFNEDDKGLYCDIEYNENDVPEKSRKVVKDILSKEINEVLSLAIKREINAKN